MMSAIDKITICDDDITIENLIAALEEGADLIEKIGISESLSREDMQKRLVEHNRNIAHLLKVAYRKKQDEWQATRDFWDAMEYSLRASAEPHQEWFTPEFKKIVETIYHKKIDAESALSKQTILLQGIKPDR